MSSGAGHRGEPARAPEPAAERGVFGILPLRNSVLFPQAVMPISVGRQKTLALVEAALNKGLPIAVVSQKEAGEDDPSPGDLFEYGTTARILKAIRITGGNINLILQGSGRVRVVEFTQTEPFLAGRLEHLHDVEERTIEVEALARNLSTQFRKLVEIHQNMQADAGELNLPEDDPVRLADLVASVLPVPVAEKMKLLPIASLRQRLETITSVVAREIQVSELGTRIQSQVMDEVGKTQRQFFLREQMKAIQKELGESDDRTREVEELREKVEKAGMTEEAKAVAERELDRLAAMSPASAEYTVARTYLDWLVSMPWSKTTDDKIDLGKARAQLDADHYDLEKVKDRILEYLAVRKRKPDLKGPILCFVGPPGVGKTSLGRSIATAMGREFVRMSLGGIRDEAEIRGHRRTYIGSLPGRIVQGLKKAGTRNPVFMLDEIDKLGADFRGDPASALLEVLDPEQNHTFSDHYLEVAFDLSRVFFITTANVLDTVPGPLRDRMEILELPGYSEEEKREIARRHLVPRQTAENGLGPAELTFEDGALDRLITEYTQEAGLRNLEREIASICRKVSRRLVEAQEKDEKPALPIALDAAAVPDYCGPRKVYREVAERTARSGVSTGLAWTSTGGDILFIESTRMPGDGKVHITGRLGEVMRESVQAAHSFLKSNAARFGIPPEVFEKEDIHVHVPAGAIPKDGPSAGCALMVSILSLLLDRPVPGDLAMTGEITLRGKVLPVGGIKEKVLAGRRAGITRILLPQKNDKDLADLPEHVKSAMVFHPVDEMDEVLRLTFGEDVFRAVPPPALAAKAQATRTPPAARA